MLKKFNKLFEMLWIDSRNAEVHGFLITNFQSELTPQVVDTGELEKKFVPNERGELETEFIPIKATVNVATGKALAITYPICINLETGMCSTDTSVFRETLDEEGNNGLVRFIATLFESQVKGKEILTGLMDMYPHLRDVFATLTLSQDYLGGWRCKSSINDEIGLPQLVELIEEQEVINIAKMTQGETKPKFNISQTTNK